MPALLLYLIHLLRHRHSSLYTRQRVALVPSCVGERLISFHFYNVFAGGHAKPAYVSGDLIALFVVAHAFAGVAEIIALSSVH